MKNSDIKTLRGLKITDLDKKVVKLKQDLFHLRFQQALGQLENTAQIGKIKKTIAVMKTIISEKAKLEKAE